MSEEKLDKGFAEKALDFAEDHKAEIGMFITTVALEGARRFLDTYCEENTESSPAEETAK